MATNFQTGYAGLFTGKTLSQLLARALRKLGETDYRRYSEDDIVDAINEMQRFFAVETRVLRGWSMIPMRAGVKSYALPKMCLPDGLERARYYASSTSYDDMELRDRDYMDDHYQGWLNASDGTPMIVVIGDWFGNVQKIDLYPPPATSGTTYADGTDLGVVTGGTDLPGTWNNITGLASGGSTTTLEDDTVDFTTMGLVAGMAVVKVNSTPGSESVGYILTIAATKLTFSDVMTESDAFVAGDSYEIMAGEVGTITDVTDEDAYLFTADVGVIGQITIPANNLLVEFRRYPVDLELSNAQYQKPEIPWAWHDVLADGAASQILMADTQRKDGKTAKLIESLGGAFAGAVMSCKTKPSMPIGQTVSISPRIKR